VNPETYLRDVLAKIAEGHPINRIDELMPWRFTRAAQDNAKLECLHGKRPASPCV
jgi:hypothetical protein